ncbi:sirohydrochlorin chelatase [Arthrobacter sp. KK5.5]|uniref:sirohydrochlorin chelatase n=1 Tax=Arthrobacter sp. KK5.5 TaxID=3373084 RepID=UPI003EE4ADEA
MTAAMLEKNMLGEAAAPLAPAFNSAWGGWEPLVRATTLVAASHGTKSPAGRAAITELVDAVAAARPDVPVAAAYVDVQTPGVDVVLDACGGSPRIVPLLLSTGFHTRHDLAGSAASAPGTTLSRALGPDPRLATVLQRRLVEAGLRRGDQVILACAGSTDPQGIADCHAMGRLLSDRLGTGVETAFVSAAGPSVPEAVERASSRSRRRWFARGRVVVATYLMAPGHFAAMVAGCGADVVSAPLLVPGTEVPAELVELVLERFDRL